MRFASVFRRPLTIAALALPLAAAAFPDKPIEWVVPYPAGGGSDVVARTLAEPMAKTLGQSIVVNNKPGAATNIGADYAAKAKADGHVVLTADTATLAANPWLYSKLGYNAEKDFAPVGLLARFPMLLVVNTSVPAKNLAEFSAWAKTQSGGVNYATPGSGSPHHLATELFRERSGLKLVHVPYRGAAPAVQDVIGGQVPFMFVDSATGYPHIQSGKLRAIGVASPKRVPNFDSVPTLAEQGLKDFEAYAWQGVVVPAATPAEAVAALNKALRCSARQHRGQGALPDARARGNPGTPAQMAATRRPSARSGARSFAPTTSSSTDHRCRLQAAKPVRRLDGTVTYRLHTLGKLTDRVSQAAYLDERGCAHARGPLPGGDRRVLAAVGERSCPASEPEQGSGQPRRAVAGRPGTGAQTGQRHRRARRRADADRQGRALLAARDGRDRAAQSGDRRLPR